MRRLRTKSRSGATSPPGDEPIAADDLQVLLTRLAEAEETLRAIRAGEVDAIVVNKGDGAAMYTLKSAADPYRALVETMSEGGLTVSATGVIVYCNTVFARLLGLPRERVIGARLGDFVALKDFSSLTEFIGGRDVKLRGVEREVDVRISAAALAIDGLPIHCLIVTDLSRQQLRLRHEAVVQSTMDAVYSLDKDLNVETWNHGAEQLYKYTASEAIGRSLRSLLVPDDHIEKYESVVARVKAGESVRLETVRVVKDGGCIDVSSSWTPILTEDGVLLGIAAISRDITGRHEAERALRAAHDSFRYLVENSPFGVYAVDADFRLVMVSAGAQKVFETVRPLIGRDFAEVLRTLWPAPFADEAIGHFRHTLATGEPYRSPGTIELRRDIGEVESYDWKVERVTLPDGRFGVVCHFYDLSERLRFEAALRESEERLRYALSAAKAGVWSWNIDSGELNWSPENYALYGFDPANGAVTYSGWERAVHPEDKIAMNEAMRAVVEGRSSELRIEFRVRHSTGEVRWLLGIGNVERDAKGQPFKLLGLTLDISDRKRAEQHAEFLMKEVNHRSKNLLSVVQAVARQTARESDPGLFVDRFGSRLSGLAASHDLLVKSEWRGVELGELTRSQLLHFADLIGYRITVEGPPIQITPSAAQAIGMAVHELATNAGKHGALSNARGVVRIAWQLVDAGAQQRFAMQWSETDGPPAAPPSRRGFGHTVLVDLVGHALDAEVSLTYPASGLVWTLKAPVKSVVSEHFRRAGVSAE